MPSIGSYSVTSIPGYELVTKTDLYDNIDDLLVNLLDNEENLIDPIDIRSPIYSLWKRVDDLDLIVGSESIGTGNFFYSNPNPVPFPGLGGIAGGTTFSNVSISDMFDRLLYPYQGPLAGISILGDTSVEFGNPTKLSTNSITLNWNVTKRSNNITSITVNGVPQSGSPWSTSVSGSQQRTGTHSPSGGLSQTQTFSISVSDGTSTSSSSATLTWLNRVYWGTINLSSIGNPNLTLNPASASLVSSVITDSVIRNLAFNSLSTTKNRTIPNFGGSGNYLVFAWPTSVPGSDSPVWTVGGLVVSAFTRLRTDSTLINQYGFAAKYEVFISNTAQNSPVTIVIS